MGNLFFVDVDEAATVQHLKRLIGDQEHLPTSRLILMLDAEERRLMEEDDNILREYGVQDGSHVYVFFQSIDNCSSAPPVAQDSATDKPSSLDAVLEPDKSEVSSVKSSQSDSEAAVDGNDRLEEHLDEPPPADERVEEFPTSSPLNFPNVPSPAVDSSDNSILRQSADVLGFL